MATNGQTPNPNPNPNPNPGQQNPGQQNPGQQNPGQQNPGQQNPGQQNPGQNPNPNPNSVSSSTLSIPQTAAAGGITFTQPAQTAAASYYKIAPGQLITFAWNMTSVLSTPQHLTFTAFCAENGNSYPVGPSDGVIPATQSSIIWDPSAYQSANPEVPLAMGSYTLSVWDDRGPTATPAPGLFSPNAQLRFALYTTQSYTPLSSGWQCQGCNAASPNSIAHGFPVALIATCVILLFSGLGILRTVMGVRVRRD